MFKANNNKLNTFIKLLRTYTLLTEYLSPEVIEGKGCGLVGPRNPRVRDVGGISALIRKVPLHGVQEDSGAQAGLSEQLDEQYQGGLRRISHCFPVSANPAAATTTTTTDQL